MSLSKIRKQLRHLAFLHAGSMIEDMHQGGMTWEESGCDSPEEFQMMCEENIRAAKVIYKIAMKYYEEEENE